MNIIFEFVFGETKSPSSQLFATLVNEVSQLVNDTAISINTRKFIIFIVVSFFRILSHKN
jgi:hypothetical protein